MKLEKNQKLHLLMIAFILPFIFQSCSSLGDWELEPYEGELTWEQITKKAAWDNRLDLEVAVLNDELYLAGGYNPGAFGTDPYYEDVWKSNNGKDWTNVTENAPWQGRRGHSLLTFDDGSGDALYLIGGFSVNEATGERAYNNDVWRSTDGENWTAIKQTTEVEMDSQNDWIARMHHKCVVANHAGQNYIYLIGGHTMTEGIDGRYAIRYCNDVWRSTDGITWENIGITDFGIRSEHAIAVSPDGTIYIQGGHHGVIFDANDSTGTKPIPDYANVWQSTDGATWTNSADSTILKTGFFNRTGHEMVFYGDKIWTLPGKTNSLNHYSFTNPNHYGTWTLDMNGNFEIDARGITIDARHSYAAIVWQNRIWILGGNTNRNGQDNDVWAGDLN
ncbi:MAG: hypothetical protein AB8G11_10240 [Saprospiraceae bacterium]